MTKASEYARQIGDREAIRNCIYRYSRGVDRCDEDLVRSAFWPDAVADWGFFKGGPDELIAWAWPQLQAMHQTVHHLGNMLIECHRDHAQSETYLTAYHRLPGENGQTDLIVGARYLDRLDKRDDEWRISRRKVVQEWFRQFEDSGNWAQSHFGSDQNFGTRDRTDPSYEFLHAGR